MCAKRCARLLIYFTVGSISADTEGTELTHVQCYALKHAITAQSIRAAQQPQPLQPLDSSQHC